MGVTFAVVEAHLLSEFGLWRLEQILESSNRTLIVAYCVHYSEVKESRRKLNLGCNQETREKEVSKKQEMKWRGGGNEFEGENYM